LSPPGGNATVPLGQSVTIAVRIDGKAPSPPRPDTLNTKTAAGAKTGPVDAPKLLFRTTDADPYQERWLDYDSSREWSTKLEALYVGNGSFYKVSYGDASTPEYRVDVHAPPMIKDNGFKATLRRRPYLGLSDHVQTERELKDYRATTVTLDVQTNCKVKDGR